MTTLIIILSLSIILQILAAFYAFRLIRITKERLIWLSVIIAIILMASRRIISFIALLKAGVPTGHSVNAESIALIISLLMLYGFYKLNPVLNQLYAAYDGLQIKVREKEMLSKSLEQSERKWKHIINALPQYIAYCDKNNVYQFVNDSYLKGFKISRDQILGKTVASFVGAKAWSTAKNHVAKVQAGKKVSYHEFFNYKHGKKVHMSGTLIPNIQKNGIQDGYYAVLTDITDTVKTLELINEQKELHEMITQNTSEGIFISNLEDYTITFLNSALSKITGYSEDWFYSLDAEKLSGLISNEEQQKILEKFDKIRSGNTVQFEILISTKTGAKKWVEITVDSIKYQSKISVIGLLKDITERKEEALITAQSEEEFRALADSSPMLIWRSGTDAKCDYFNQPWLRFRGRTMEEEKGDGWTEGIHPEDKEKVVHDYLEAFKKRVAFTLEYRLQNAKGEYRWLLDKGSPVYSPNHEFKGYIGSCVDLTELFTLHKQVEQSEAKYRNLFDSNPLGLFRSTPEGKFIEANPTLAEMLGYETPEKLIASISNIAEEIYVQPGERKDIINKTKEEATNESFINEYKRKDGSRFTAKLYLNKTLPPDGDMYLDGIVEDISKQQEMQVSLEKSEREKTVILDALEQKMVYCDMNLHIIWMNKAAREDLEFSDEEMQSMKCHEIWHQRNTPCKNCPVLKSYKTGKPATTEFLFDNKYMQLSSYPVLDNDGKIEGVVEMGTDLTKIKSYERKLKRSEEKLRKLNQYEISVIEKEKSAIAHEIHDELGQYLTAIKLDSAWLQKQCSEGNEIKSKLNDIQQLSDSAIKKIREISNQLKPTLIDNLGLIAAMEWLSDSFAKRTDIHFHTSFPDEELVIDKNRAITLFRILQEAIINVIRHANASNIWINMVPSKKDYHLQIKDDGKGINVRRNELKTFGINGMIERARMFNGDFRIEPMQPRGTEINVKIPVKS